MFNNHSIKGNVITLNSLEEFFVIDDFFNDYERLIFVVRVLPDEDETLTDDYKLFRVNIMFGGEEYVYDLSNDSDMRICYMNAYIFLNQTRKIRYLLNLYSEHLVNATFR